MPLLWLGTSYWRGHWLLLWLWRIPIGPPLPSLPLQYTTFINDARVSKLSRKFNVIFSFAATESTHTFPNIAQELGLIAMEGQLYHRVWPTHQILQCGGFCMTTLT